MQLMKRKTSTSWQLPVLIWMLLSSFSRPGIILGDENKWIAIGALHNWYSSAGCEIEVGRRHLLEDQQDGLRWPGYARYQDSQAGKALWIGCKNYYDQLVNKTFSYKVVHVGPRLLDENTEIMPVTFKMIGRFSTPLVTVDGILASNNTFMDLVDEVDPNLPADRMLYNVVNTSLGITITRKIYAFCQQYHDNYFISDYVLKNTGVIDKKGTKRAQTLTDVVFFFQYRYAPTKESGPNGYNFAPQNSSWGRNTVNEVLGENPASGDPFRALFSWHGKHSGWGGAGDEIGVPNFLTDGHLTAQQFVGVVTIHADKSAQDKSNDPYQPTTTKYFDADGSTSSGNDQFNENRMALEYADMTAGHPALSHAEAVGNGNADEFGSTAGGYSQVQGFGPYTLAPGDSIHLVMAEGVAGVSREQGYLIGANYLTGTAPFRLPDGTTTNSPNAYKNAWVFTGRDSILQTFTRAVANYQSQFQIPQPPPPPAIFEVISGGDRIILKWSNNAESHPGFAGYRLYRALHTPDTTFNEIFACGTGTPQPTITRTYNDTTAVRGFNYYYYIIAYDNGSRNQTHLNPHGALTSTLYLSRTNEPAFLKRQAGDRLDSIQVVPNPYNINARDLQYGVSAPDRIMFLDIPPFCTIKIFTERGDLIETIDHNDGSGDEAWNSITSSRQTVVSGVYIAYFEVTQDYADPATRELRFRKGQSTYRKFVIIR
ncbi:fibronectin [candidate division KSB1 bacterium]|nr:fibronectin [candidate division KSB1 bacterium]